MQALPLAAAVRSCAPLARQVEILQQQSAAGLQVQELEERSTIERPRAAVICRQGVQCNAHPCPRRVDPPERVTGPRAAAYLLCFACRIPAKSPEAMSKLVLAATTKGSW